jgi:hypothetical protein
VADIVGPTGGVTTPPARTVEGIVLSAIQRTCDTQGNVTMLRLAHTVTTALADAGVLASE